MLRFLLTILVLTPLLFSRSVHRVFEIPKTSLLLVSCGLICLFAASKINNLDADPGHLRRCSKHPVSLWLLAYYFSFLISSIFSAIPTLSILGGYERNTGLISMTMFLCFFMFFLAWIRVRDIHWVILGVACTGFVISLHASFQAVGIFPLGFEEVFEQFFNRVSSTLGHPVYLGVYLAMVLPLSAVLILISETRGERIIWSAVVALMAWALIQTFSRGAFVAFTVALLCFLIFYLIHLPRGRDDSTKRPWVSIGLPVATMLAVWLTVFQILPQYEDRIATLLKFDKTARYQLFQGSLDLARQYPWIGSGPETFRVAFLPHKSLELALKEPLVNHDRAHNQYLHIWATQGTLGLIAWLGLLFAIIKSAWTSLADSSRNRTHRIYGLGLCTMALAYALVILPSFDNVTSLFLFHLLAALVIILETETEETKQEPIKTIHGIRLQSILKNSGPFVLAALSTVFIYLGSALFLGDRYFTLAGKAETTLEKIEYYENAKTWAPFETLYSYSQALAYRELALASSEHKRDLLKQAIELLQNGFSKTWLAEVYVYWMAKMFNERGNYSQAQNVLEKFMKVDRYNQTLYAEWMVALAYQGKFEETLDQLELWKIMIPQQARYYWYAGLTYESINDWFNAEIELKYAVALEPKNKSYGKELKRIRERINELSE